MVCVVLPSGLPADGLLGDLKQAFEDVWMEGLETCSRPFEIPAPTGVTALGVEAGETGQVRPASGRGG
jgi:hypothetical protein